MECRVHKNSELIPIPNRINPIPRIDIYFLLSIIILPPTCFQALLEVYFLQLLTVKILKELLPFSSTFYMPCPSLSRRVINLAILSERYSMRLLGLNIRIRILFSNVHRLRASVTARNHVSQPCNVTIFISLEVKHTK